jgi:predicted RNase H-like HicB family nuclease
MRFHNLRQAEAAIRLWIKTAKEDGLEIPQPRGRLVYA